jgi:Domain of unknown function (DUF5134)
MIPTWIFDLLAAFMLVVAAVSAARLVAARPWRHGSVIIDTDIAHLLMAIAMAGVLTRGLSTLPDAAWEVVFGVMIVWFAFRVVRDARSNGVRALAGGHCAPHLVHSGAMLYMFLGMTSAAGAMAGMAGMAGMPSMSAGSSSMPMLSDPTLAFVFALVLIGYSIWDLDQLSGRRYSLTSAPVALVGVRAGVPAMAGAESATPTAFSGPDPSSGVSDLITGIAQGSGAAGGQAVARDAVGAGERDVGGGALGQFLLSPAVTIGCRVTMGVVMTFMLLTAI